VAAIYPDLEETEATVMALVDSNIDDIDIVQLAPGAKDSGLAIEQETEAIRDTVTRDAGIGSVAGTAAGAAAGGTTALVASSLFISAPIVGPLVMLGYGTLIGGIVGAIRGLRIREGQLAGLVNDALDAGYYAVVVHAVNEQGRDRAQEIINLSMAEQTVHT
jgi:hypothetical protein